jgi:hypothetical protein
VPGLPLQEQAVRLTTQVHLNFARTLPNGLFSKRPYRGARSDGSNMDGKLHVMRSQEGRKGNGHARQYVSSSLLGRPSLYGRQHFL